MYIYIFVVWCCPPPPTPPPWLAPLTPPHFDSPGPFVACGVVRACPPVFSPPRPCGVVCRAVLCCRGGLWVSGLVLGSGFAPAPPCGAVVAFGLFNRPSPPPWCGVLCCGGGLWVSGLVFNPLPPSQWCGGGCWGCLGFGV